MIPDRHGGRLADRHLAKYCPYCREGRVCPHVQAQRWVELFQPSIEPWRRVAEDLERRAARDCPCGWRSATFSWLPEEGRVCPHVEARRWEDTVDRIRRGESVVPHRKGNPDG